MSNKIDFGRGRRRLLWRNCWRRRRRGPTRGIKLSVGWRRLL
jgi:hypothetical protein